MLELSRTKCDIVAVKNHPRVRAREHTYLTTIGSAHEGNWSSGGAAQFTREITQSVRDPTVQWTQSIDAV